MVTLHDHPPPATKGESPIAGYIPRYTLCVSLPRIYPGERRNKLADAYGPNKMHDVTPYSGLMVCKTWQ